MNKTTIQCSCCGNHEEVGRDHMFAEELVDKGWGSYGSALYCLNCTETRSDRNSDRKMADHDSTVLTIMSRMLDDAEREIRYLKDGELKYCPECGARMDGVKEK